MGVEKPQAREDIAGRTDQLEQWAQNVPGNLQDTLKVESGWMDHWSSGLHQFTELLNKPVQAMAQLRINEGAVGTFVSATQTAAALNDSRDAIQQRLDDMVNFANALEHFSTAAYKKIFEASRSDNSPQLG